MGRSDSFREAIRRVLWGAATPGGIAALFVAGLGIRLWLARGGGFPFDMDSFAAWANDLASGGIGGFYERVSFIDYPPGYLYVLWVLGELAGGPPSVLLLKLPGILADLALAGVVAALAVRLTPLWLQRRLNDRLGAGAMGADRDRAMPVAALAAAAVLLNPAIFFISAVWGQVDAILAVLVAASFLLLGTGRPSMGREAGGMAVLALAVGTKPQAAFVVPVVVLLLLWRHLRGAMVRQRGGEARDAAGAAAAAVGRVALLGLVAVATGVVLAAPFGLGVVEIFRFYLKASQTYTVTSVFAFNLWGAVGFWKPDSASPDAVTLFGVPALVVGLGLFAALGGLVLWRAWRSLRSGQHDGRVLVFGGAAFVMVAFAVLTRIHERYLFLALALLAPLLAYRGLRRAFAGLSVLYLANVYFPYVYYLEYKDRPAPKIEPLFNAVYGTSLESPQLKALSALTAVAVLFVAARGWRWVEARRTDVEPPAAEPDALFGGVGAAAHEPAPRKKAVLRLHPVGRRGAALGAVAFAIVLGSRLVGLGSPPGMYFDEVYHARTAGEYLQGKEVYEWTHPPLAKELMALSVAWFAEFGVAGRGDAPPGLADGVVAATEDGVVWGRGDGSLSGTVHGGSIGEGCAVGEPRRGVPVELRPSAVAAGPGGVFVAGTDEEGPALARVADGRQVWLRPIPGLPADIAAVGEGALVVTQDGSLVRASAGGELTPLGADAAHVTAGDDEAAAWVSFPAAREVVSFDAEGARQTTVSTQGEPGVLALAAGSDRLLVVTDGRRIEAVDTETNTRTDELDVAAERLGTVGQTGLVWAADGGRVRVIEPRGLSVLGTAELGAPADALVPDVSERRMAAVAGGDLACLAGRPAFGWRLGSAVFGAAVAALAGLLALRLFGSLLVAGLAALFVAVDGLAFVMSRIAMNDSYVTAFLLAAWFSALAVLYHWTDEDGDGRVLGAGRRRRGVALGWLAAAGVAGGLALGSKWVGLYSLAGIGLLFGWDVLARGRRGLLSLGGGPARSVALVGLLMAVVPLGVYVATYVPYFRLGHGFGELIELQRGMYGYHANLEASHPYGSPWYGWPVGYKAVWLYLNETATRRAEIWTLGNPVVFLGGLVGMLAAAREGWRRRSVALGVVVLAAAVQYLPWTLVDRVTFLYHYLPVVPFLAVALAWWIAGSGDEADARRPRLLRIAGVALAAVAAFVVLLPILDGWLVPTGYLESVKATLFWMF